MFNFINTYIKKLLRFNKLKKIKAKNIMIIPDEFSIKDLKLGNTYKVHEDIFVKDFISKIQNDKLTIIVVDNKGQTQGYINEQQIKDNYV